MIRRPEPTTGPRRLLASLKPLADECRRSGPGTVPSAVPVRRRRTVATHAVERRSTMTTTITCRTELAHRTSDGVDVYLFWYEPTNRVAACGSPSAVGARRKPPKGRRLSGSFEVDGRNAPDAFNHPYAYAGRAVTTTSPHSWTASPPRPTTAATRRKRRSTNGGAIMHARIDNPAVTVPGALQGSAGTGHRGRTVRHPRRQRCISSSCVRARSTAAASASTCTRTSSSWPRTGRANQHCHRLAGNPLLHRGRAGRPRTDRGCRASGRSARRGPRRRLGRGSTSLRQGAARGARHRDRDDQRLQPHQCHHPASHRRHGHGGR